MRYRQNNITRAFAYEKLVESGDIRNTRQRHAEHFLYLAEEASVQRDHLPASDWLAIRDILMDDICEGLNWAFDDHDSADLAVRLSVVAIPFWRDGSDDCLAFLQQALSERYQDNRDTRQNALLHLAISRVLASAHGENRESRAAAARALAFAKELGDADLWAVCLAAVSLRPEPAAPMVSPVTDLAHHNGSKHER